MDDSSRSIRAPSTIIKSSKPRTYNGPMAQTRFRLLNSIGIKPPDMLNQNQQTSILQPTTVTTSSSRIPQKNHKLAMPEVELAVKYKPSGIVKPTPVRHVISAASTTSAIRQPTQRPLPTLRPSSSGSKLSVATKKPTAFLTNHHHVNSNNLTQQSKQTSHINDVVLNGASSNSNLVDVSKINSVTGDVSAIRRLLEQLLGLLQSSSQETKDIQESYETLERENERLRMENAELRDRLLAINQCIEP